MKSVQVSVEVVVPRAHQTAWFAVWDVNSTTASILSMFGFGV